MTPKGGLPVAERKIRLLIDADGCPVVNEAVAAARRYGIPCVIFCDFAHEIEREGAETVIVPQGADSADLALANRAQPGDVAVTQDYGLAALCLARGVLPLSQDGLLYTRENNDALLLSRHTARRLRQGGVRLKGPKKRTRDQDARFVRALDALLEQAISGPKAYPSSTEPHQ